MFYKDYESTTCVYHMLKGRTSSASCWINITPAGIYLLKINNINSRARYEICSKLAIKTPERRHWHLSGVFIANFHHISNVVLVFLLLTLNCNCRLGLAINISILVVTKVDWRKRLNFDLVIVKNIRWLIWSYYYQNFK